MPRAELIQRFGSSKRATRGAGPYRFHPIEIEQPCTHLIPGGEVVSAQPPWRSSHGADDDHGEEDEQKSRVQPTTRHLLALTRDATTTGRRQTSYPHDTASEDEQIEKGAADDTHGTSSTGGHDSHTTRGAAVK
jgi:hypothetical protein